MTRKPVKRICLITTTPFIANSFLKPHVLELSKTYDLTLVLNTQDGYLLDEALASHARIQHVAIERRIAPLRDVAALWKLITFLRHERFDVIHSIAPKAGLLGMIAGYAANVRVRIHTFQGEVWASKQGPVHALLKMVDRLVGKLATHRLVVGRGEQAFLEEQGVLAAGDSTVLASGSIVGVDVNRFRPDLGARVRVRAELCIPQGGLLVMYLGRMGREKGVLDLAQAFKRIAEYLSVLHLVFVGPDEGEVRPALESAIGARRDRVRFVGYTRTPEVYLAAADMLCLPSYREGFNVSLIEAGACAVPVIASRLYGTTDAVVDGVTGILHEPGDLTALAAAVSLLASDAHLRSRMGSAGRERAETHFRSSILLAALRAYYARVLSPGDV